jgi:hypothetical protein
MTMIKIKNGVWQMIKFTVISYFFMVLWLAYQSDQVTDLNGFMTQIRNFSSLSLLLYCFLTCLFAALMILIIMIIRQFLSSQK